jgi:two-component system, cell cycle response regulator DivK
VRRTILLVEDVALNRDLMVQILEDQYKVLEASNGRRGVELALEQQPDVILMDLSLPVLDGWEAIKEIKANPRTKGIPIAALTAHAMRGDKHKALSAGCDAYLTKPIDEALLLQTLRTLLNSTNT